MMKQMMLLSTKKLTSCTRLTQFSPLRIHYATHGEGDNDDVYTDGGQPITMLNSRQSWVRNLGQIGNWILCLASNDDTEAIEN